MTDPAFSPITSTEMAAWAVIIPTVWLLCHVGIQWERRCRARQECRAHHPASKGLPRR